MSSSEQLSSAFCDRLGADGLAERTTTVWDQGILVRLRELLVPGQRILNFRGYRRTAIPLAQSDYDASGRDMGNAIEVRRAIGSLERPLSCRYDARQEP
jgi:hypothetical protein